MLPQAVADLWCSNISSYIEFPLHTVHNDVQMQLAHALNDSLVGFVVPGEVEGGVLLGQLIQRSSHLVIVCFALGLNGNLQRQSLTQPLGQGHKTGNSRRVPQQVEGEHPVAVMGNVPGIFKNKFTNSYLQTLAEVDVVVYFDDRIWELHALQHDGRLLITQCLSSDDVLQTPQSNNATQVGTANQQQDVGLSAAADLDVLSVVGMHELDATNTLLLALVRVGDKGGSSRSDGDASLLLLSHPVHSGSALMHLPNLVSSGTSLGTAKSKYARSVISPEEKAALKVVKP
ncbi:MAG: hypothetical protein FRX49_12089 [Trebouxia sp. A1-2]|nr:MAG: hypothetical protein FRX49_12089 [Trebouxia sp. A1-2]